MQGMVGFDAVRRPVLQGGRSPAARQALVPWGERAVDLRPTDRPWPGRVPGPAPVRVFAAPPAAQVEDATGRDVAVTDRGVVTGEPCRFRVGSGDLPWQPVTAWAGPWPTDESWWSGGSGLAARFQVVGALSTQVSSQRLQAAAKFVRRHPGQIRDGVDTVFLALLHPATQLSSNRTKLFHSRIASSAASRWF